MRYGIMEMQLNDLVPSSRSIPEALALIQAFDHNTIIQNLVADGFNLIELGGDLSLFFPNAFSPAGIERLMSLKNEYHLTYTIHLPLWSVEPSTPLRPVREGSYQALIDIIRAARPLNPEVHVLHATGALAAEFYHMRLPESARDLLMKQFQLNAVDSLKHILTSTGLSPRQLAIETIEFPMDLTLQMADLLDLSICLDTGHVLAGFPGPLPFNETLELCLPRLAEIHLHDSPAFSQTGEIGYGKDHQPLGSGDLDIPQLLGRLARGNFDGPVIFELPVIDAQQSLQRIREISDHI